MKTYMAKAEGLERKWYVIDAEGKTFGRLASQVAAILKGKHKPIYAPHMDCGDFVIVTNVDKLVFTGNKLDLMANKPEFAFTKAVKGMLPKNSLGRSMLKKLKVYAGPEHKHEAQQPQKLDI